MDNQASSWEPFSFDSSLTIQEDVNEDYASYQTRSTKKKAFILFLIALIAVTLLGIGLGVSNKAKGITITQLNSQN